MIPLDRARRVVLGTSMEQLEHVSERIHGRITSPKAYFRGYLSHFGHFSERYRRADDTIG